MSSERYDGFYIPERYISRSRPEQIAAHIIEVYSFVDHSWRSWNAQYLIPRGNLQRILSVDLGKLLPELAEKVHAEGQYSSRRKNREESLTGNRKFKLPEAWRNLERYIISAFETHEDGIQYSFSLRKDEITLEKPLEFQIINYLADNKEIIAVSREKAVILAKRWKDTTIPIGDFKLRYIPGAVDFGSDKKNDAKVCLKN